MSRIMKTVATLFLAVVLLAPSVSYAQTTPNNSLQALINALLAQIAVLQAQLDGMNGGGTTPTNPATTSTTFSVTPASGLVPFTVAATVSVDMGTATCGATYLGRIDWDDGSRGDGDVIAQNMGCERVKQATIWHEFDYGPDTFSVSLKDRNGKNHYQDIAATVEEGPFLDAVSTSAYVTTMNPIASSYGTYTIRYDVTADHNDIYIPQSSGPDLFYPQYTEANRASGMSPGAAYVITTEGSFFVGSKTSTLTSTAKSVGNYFVVREGDTETFTLTVTLNPNSNSSLKIRLSSVAYANSAKAPDQWVLIHNYRDFETQTISIPESGTAPVQTATYQGYLNDSLFITTKGITREEALKNCKQNASNNPQSAIRCTWGGEEIYARAATSTGTPDLTVRNASATASGGTISANATIANAGNGATPGSFRSVWRVCDSNCTNYDRNGNDLMSALSAGASAVTSFAHTITAAPGLYYYMICADVPYYQVAESDEGNNCTGWQAITVN